jgi:uncharacterized protein (DUF1919 family)
VSGKDAYETEITFHHDEISQLAETKDQLNETKHNQTRALLQLKDDELEKLKVQSADKLGIYDKLAMQTTAFASLKSTHKVDVVEFAKANRKIKELHD